MVKSVGGKSGLVRSYGMFSDRAEVDWVPGAETANQFRLLGRSGKVHPKVEVCDFRNQRSTYVLYDDHGHYHGGLSRTQDIGNRLRVHTRDHHADQDDAGAP